MAEIIDIRERRRQGAPGTAAVGTGAVFKVRLCGPDLHWVGVVGGVLAGALAAEGLPAAIAALTGTPAPPFAIELITGEPAPLPALLVAGCALPAAMLQGCDRRTLLLARRQGGRGEQAVAFPGREVPLPTSEPATAPLRFAAACAGGAARLLGIVGWSALEQALRQELTLALPIEAFLIQAFESYQRLAPWTGAALAEQS